jgi:hypothetical protein
VGAAHSESLSRDSSPVSYNPARCAAIDEHTGLAENSINRPKPATRVGPSTSCNKRFIAVIVIRSFVCGSGANITERDLTSHKTSVN